MPTPDNKSRFADLSQVSEGLGKLLERIRPATKEVSPAFEAKIKSLEDKLPLLEPFNISYNGVTALMLHFARINELDAPLPMREKPGSVAQLARQKLAQFLALPNLAPEKRRRVEKALGIQNEGAINMEASACVSAEVAAAPVPDKLSEEYIKVKFLQAEKTEKSRQRFEEEWAKFERAKAMFREVFPGEEPVITYMVGLKEDSKGNYIVSASGVKGAEIFRRDFSNPFNNEEFTDYMLSIEGELSRKIITGTAA